MQDTKIEWAHNTFNPWTGCAKVSPACKHCYAERMAARRRIGWGVNAERVPASEAMWAQPLVWDRRAARTGERERVFCSSMADVFEDRRELDKLRARLWALIARTPNLDWLLLTKRPECISRMVPWGSDWPSNVWIGTTTENQEEFDRRSPHLLALPAAVRFVSAEPLLGPIDMRVALAGTLDWVIVGGESGHGARPMRPEWARDLRDQVHAAGKRLHFKQWGSHDSNLIRLKTKKEAGRALDGRTWDEFPTARYPGEVVVVDALRARLLSPAPPGEYFAYLPSYVQAQVHP